MIKIDLLIQIKNQETTLSELGLEPDDVEYGSAQLETYGRIITSRSGKIHSGGRFTSKRIRATGKIRTSSLNDFQEIVDKVNGLLISKDPYYITQLLPLTNELYGYQNPGESTGDLDWDGIEKTKYKYRFKVTSESGLETTFLGASNAGYLYKFEIEFITVELPFGETVPQLVELKNTSIKYNGTVENSQLEYPWKLRLTATERQTGTFMVRLNEREYTYDSDTDIVPGDVFVLTGIETIKNGTNVTHYTNYEYLVLEPKINQLNEFNTTFIGKIEVINFVELYK